MATDKELRRPVGEFFFYASCIPSGVATDVDHIYFHSFAPPPLLQRVYASDIITVYIAVYTCQRPEGLQLFSDAGVAEIAGMPDLIAVFKMGEHLLIQVVMRI